MHTYAEMLLPLFIRLRLPHAIDMLPLRQLMPFRHFHFGVASFAAITPATYRRMLENTPTSVIVDTPLSRRACCRRCHIDYAIFITYASAADTVTCYADITSFDAMPY